MAPSKSMKIVCTECRTYHANTFFCRQCNACKRRCQCRKRAAVGVVRVPRVNGAGIGSSSMVINSRRAVGLEVELSSFGSWYAPEKSEGYLMSDGAVSGRRPHYVIDHDGSVHPSKREAVIEPLSGDQGLIHGLNCLATQVYMHNCEVNNTCGYHVHVDATDFYWTDIQKLLVLWIKMEKSPSLWLIAGRDPTNFSKTWDLWLTENNIDGKEFVNADLDRFKELTIQALYNKSIRRYPAYIKNVYDNPSWQEHVRRWNTKQLREDGLVTRPRVADYISPLRQHLDLKANRGWNRAVPSRYLDLNIHSWLYRGTVEYRLGAGTVDQSDIRMWPLWCLWLTEAVNQTSLGHIKTLTTFKDPIAQLVKQGGMMCPQFNLADTTLPCIRLYKMPHYLIDWVSNKLKKGEA